jgi:hypothetical protein
LGPALRLQSGISRPVGNAMIKCNTGGSMVFIASMSGHIVNWPQQQGCYNASKAGVIMLEKSRATEWAQSTAGTASTRSVPVTWILSFGRPEEALEGAYSHAPLGWWAHYRRVAQRKSLGSRPLGLGEQEWVGTCSFSTTRRLASAEAQLQRVHEMTPSVLLVSWVTSECTIRSSRSVPLQAVNTWALSGTPIKNAVEDIYPILSFLKHPTCQTLEAFRELVPTKAEPMTKARRVQVLLRGSILRRTKKDMLLGEPLVVLPKKRIQILKLSLDPEETSPPTT